MVGVVRFANVSKMWSYTCSWTAVLFVVSSIWAFGAMTINTSDITAAEWLFLVGNITLTAKAVTSPRLDDGYRPYLITLILLAVAGLSVFQFSWLEGKRTSTALTSTAVPLPTPATGVVAPAGTIVTNKNPKLTIPEKTGRESVGQLRTGLAPAPKKQKTPVVPEGDYSPDALSKMSAIELHNRLIIFNAQVHGLGETWIRDYYDEIRKSQDCKRLADPHLNACEATRQAETLKSLRVLTGEFDTKYLPIAENIEKEAMKRRAALGINTHVPQRPLLMQGQLALTDGSFYEVETYLGELLAHVY